MSINPHYLVILFTLVVQPINEGDTRAMIRWNLKYRSIIAVILDREPLNDKCNTISYNIYMKCSSYCVRVALNVIEDCLLREPRATEDDQNVLLQLGR